LAMLTHHLLLFFFDAPPPPVIYTLSLHDALPITVAAALGVTAAKAGMRTLVVTVDPAQRLATALGLAGLGHEPEPHADLENLWVAMLDSGASWRAVAERHAAPDVAERLARNEFFLAAAEHF